MKHIRKKYEVADEMRNVNYEQNEIADE